MIAASGLSVDAEKRILRLAPYTVPLTVPVVTCFCSATAAFTEDRLVLTVEESSLDGWTVEAPAGFEIVIADNGNE